MRSVNTEFRSAEYKIDFVISWVDGSDPAWISNWKKAQCTEGDTRESRFRDMGTLRYWFRGIEKYAPWVNKIYFVTCGQHPTWLNINHDKLVCVNHSDFIPKEYLPTFSSQAIEVNFHRISNLSEHFVYFNDDMFITAPTNPEDFFVKGFPCDSAVINYAAPRVEPLNLVPFVNVAAINRNFIKKQVLRENWKKFYTLKYRKYLAKNIQFIIGKWFPGFKYFHIPSSLLKSTYIEVWQKERELMERTSRHQFRVLTDANQWIFQNWQICKGNFYPRDIRIGYFGSIEDKKRLKDTVQAIKSQNYKLVCANDENFDDFALLVEELQKAFECIFPEKSKFEV